MTSGIRIVVTVCTIMATLMQSLDSTIANVALPYMQGTMSASQDEINWVLTSYIVANSIMIPMTGWISARVGRKRYFLISVCAFVAAWSRTHARRAWLVPRWSRRRKRS